MSEAEKVNVSLRDWFAGQALARIADRAQTFVGKDETAASMARVARLSYLIADAMLAEREK